MYAQSIFLLMLALQHRYMYVLSKNKKKNQIFFIIKLSKNISIIIT